MENLSIHCPGVEFRLRVARVYLLKRTNVKFVNYWLCVHMSDCDPLI